MQLSSYLLYLYEIKHHDKMKTPRYNQTDNRPDWPNQERFENEGYFDYYGRDEDTDVEQEGYIGFYEEEE